MCTYFSTRNPCCGKSAVPEHDLAAGDDHGDVGGCDMEAIQQFLDAGMAMVGRAWPLITAVLGIGTLIATRPFRGSYETSQDDVRLSTLD